MSRLRTAQNLRAEREAGRDGPNDRALQAWRDGYGHGYRQAIADIGAAGGPTRVGAAWQTYWWRVLGMMGLTKVEIAEALSHPGELVG